MNQDVTLLSPSPLAGVDRSDYDDDCHTFIKKNPEVLPFSSGPAKAEVKKKLSNNKENSGFQKKKRVIFEKKSQSTAKKLDFDADLSTKKEHTMFKRKIHEAVCEKD